MKEMGVALAIGVLLDATIVRGIALPATVALLGRHGPRVAEPAWKDAPAPAHVR